jgi:dTDP-glucose 4,6-dehydratase
VEPELLVLILFLILNNSGHYITNMDSLTYAGNIGNIQTFEKSDRYRFIQCDIRNVDNLNMVFDQEYDAVINFAAESHAAAFTAVDQFV